MLSRLYTLSFLLFFAFSCTENQERERIHSAYYWTTTFNMSPLKTDFLKRNNIKRLYVRFFDVVMAEQGAMPNATIEFRDSMPVNIEIVPTVFIMNDCMAQKQEDLSHKIVERVLKMCRTHDITNVREMQIDCDWTARTEQNYFSFLDELRNQLQEKGMALSVTIRLHQLSMTTPPADRGILMLYNTGDVTDRSCHNPILDIRDVKPYLKYLDDYKLNLSAAYPLFSWNVLFRGNQFIGIQHYEGEYPTLPGDTIINHSPDVSDIIQTKQAVQRASSSVNNEIILYDLSDKNIEKFSMDDFTSFYE